MSLIAFEAYSFNRCAVDSIDQIDLKSPHCFRASLISSSQEDSGKEANDLLTKSLQERIAAKRGAVVQNDELIHKRRSLIISKSIKLSNLVDAIFIPAFSTQEAVW